MGTIRDCGLKNGDNVHVEVQCTIDSNMFIPITLTGIEILDLFVIVTETNTIDETNMGWLAESSTNDFLRVNLLSPTIDENITMYDKGIVLNEGNSILAATTVTALVDSILLRKFSVDGGNIIGWLIIKRLDEANFKIEVAICDTLDEVNSIDINFVDYTSAAPIPTEINLLNPTIINQNIKVFSMGTLTFEDPYSVVGESYDISVDFKDIEATTIDILETTTVIQDI